MGLESATYIPELTNTNPIGASDPKSEGDDHIRLLKKTILNTFGSFVGTAGVPKSVTLTEDEINDCLQKAINNTLVGRLVTDDSTTSRAGFNIPDGVAPTSPAQGDIWATATDILARNNGVTSSLLSLATVQALKTSDETISSDTVFSEDSALNGVVIPTGSAFYHVDGILRVTSPAAADFKWKFVWTETPTEVGISSTYYNITSGHNADGTNLPLQTFRHDQTNVLGPIVINGTFKAGATPGTLSIHWAQETSNGSNTTVHAGSFMRITKLS